MLTNKKFAKESKVFISACKIAGVDPTSRQSSKYLNCHGKAFKFISQAKKELLDESKNQEKKGSI